MQMSARTHKLLNAEKQEKIHEYAARQIILNEKYSKMSIESDNTNKKLHAFTKNYCVE